MPSRDFEENGDYHHQCCRMYPEVIGKITLVIGLRIHR